MVDRLDETTAIHLQLKSRTSDRDEAYEKTRDQNDAALFIEEITKKNYVISTPRFCQ